MDPKRKRHDLVSESAGCLDSASERAKPTHRYDYCHQENCSCEHYERCLDEHLAPLIREPGDLSSRLQYELEKLPFKRYRETRASCYEPRAIPLRSEPSNLNAFCTTTQARGPKNSHS